MSRKGVKIPDSDVSARHGKGEIEAERNEQPLENLDDLQTSNKAGGHSTVEKLAASRSEFAPRSSAGPVAGAFGKGVPHPSGTGLYRCNACGRYFDVERDLREHETECRAAKVSTHEGAAELAHEDSTPHLPNDQGRSDRG